MIIFRCDEGVKAQHKAEFNRYINKVIIYLYMGDRIGIY
jgi:hypothetical protein